MRSVIKRFLGKKDVTSGTRSADVQGLTDRGKRKIADTTREEPKITSSEIIGIVKSEPKERRLITVQSPLRIAGYESRVARRKPRINKARKDRSSLLIMYIRKYSILGQNTVLRRKQVSYFSM